LFSWNEDERPGSVARAELSLDVAKNKCAGNKPVTLAPIPVTNEVVDNYKNDKNFKAWSVFTLPNGMVSLGRYNQSNHYLPKPNADGAKIELIKASFQNGTEAGMQIATKAGINPTENNKVLLLILASFTPFVNSM